MILIQLPCGRLVHSIHARTGALAKTPMEFAKNAKRFETQKEAEKWLTRGIKKCKDLSGAQVVMMDLEPLA